MIALYPKYEGLVSIFPSGKLGNIKTIQLSKNISTKIFPEPKAPSLDELRIKLIQETRIYSKPAFRNVRLSNVLGGIRIQPLTNMGGLSIYSASMKKPGK